MIASSRSYAIGMAHFKMAGGWMTLLLLLGAYAVIVAGGSGLYFYANLTSGYPVHVTSGAVSLLVAGQCIGLLFFGSVRIASAIQLDINSHMIESHRLMPIPNWRAVGGYILGAGGHSIAFGLLGTFLVGLFGILAGVDLGSLLVGQFLILLFTLLVWTLIVFSTFHFKHAVSIIIVLVIFGGCSQGMIFAIFPGVALLVGPLLGHTVFYGFTPPDADMMSILMASVIGQAGMIALLFMGACRKYRDTYPSTFNMPQAILVLLAWAAVSAAAMNLWPNMFKEGMLGWYERSGDWLTKQMVGSLLLTMVVAMIAVRTFFVRETTRTVTSWERMGILAAIPLVAAFTMVGTFGLKGPDRDMLEPSTLLLSFVLLCTHVLTVYFLFRITRGLRTTSLALIMVGGLAALWLGPLFLDLIQRLMFNTSETSFVNAASPIGLLYDLWISREPPNIVPGLVFLCLIPLLLGGVAALRSKHAASSLPK